MVQNLYENFRNIGWESDSPLDHFIDTISIRLLGCGISDTDTPAMTDFMLPVFLIVFYRSGSVEIRHGNQKIMLEPGSFYIFLPNEIYSGKRIGEGQLSFAYLLFDMAPFMERYSFFTLAMASAGENFQDEKYRRFGLMLEELAEEKTRRYGRPAMLRQLVRQIAAQIVYDKAVDDSQHETPKKNRDSMLVNHAYHYVATHLSEPIVIGDIIRDGGTSKTSLDRAFRSLLGTTPQRALIRYKIERSMEMLQQNLAVKIVARDLGFNSVYHFSNTFKNITGIRPTEYQRKAHVGHEETEA